MAQNNDRNARPNDRPNGPHGGQKPSPRDLVAGTTGTPRPEAPPVPPPDALPPGTGLLFGPSTKPIIDFDDRDVLDRPLTLRQVLAAFEAVSKKSRGGVYRISTGEVAQAIFESLLASSKASSKE